MSTNRLSKSGWAIPALALALGAAGCKSNTNANQGAAPIVNGTDPADANMAAPGSSGYATGQPGYTGGQPARVLSSSGQAAQQAQGEQYPEQQQPYPQTQQASPVYAQGSDEYVQTYDQDQAAVDAGQQALYAEQPPPPLPDYQQPELTEPGYEWTPGYWSYASSGYYWVPGAWVAPPYTGALWTPGYWAFTTGRYRFHHGFWGEHTGFYGGINYGFGYFGSGYRGGYWNHDRFFYNTQVNRINVNVVRNVYVHNAPVVNDYNRVSYNGPQGVRAQPSAADIAVYHERVVPAMRVQVQAAVMAAGNRQNFYEANHGRPAEAAVTQRLAADREPPPAIRPAPPVNFHPQSGNTMRPAVNQPGAAPRVDAGAQQRQQQDQQARQQQMQQQQPAQRQQQVQQQQRLQPQGNRAPLNVRPDAQQQPQSQPQSRPAPKAAPQPQIRSQPQVQPQSQQQPRPQSESRPMTPNSQPRPTPEARSTPQPAAQAAPASRPQPAPQQPRPQAAPASRPEPAPHTAEAPHEEHPHR